MQLALAWPTWFCFFSEPGAEIQLRPRCCLQGGKARGKEVALFGGEVLVFQFCPWQAYCPGDPLYLAINCLAIVFSYLSQFPYSTCQEIFLASHCPVPLIPSGRPEDRKFQFESTSIELEEANGRYMSSFKCLFTEKQRYYIYMDLFSMPLFVQDNLNENFISSNFLGESNEII